MATFQTKCYFQKVLQPGGNFMCCNSVHFMQAYICDNNSEFLQSKTLNFLYIYDIQRSTPKFPIGQENGRFIF